MSLAAQSKSTDKIVKLAVESSGLKNDCEVTSSSKVSDLKSVQSSKDRAKENTELNNVLPKSMPSHDSVKSDSKATDNKMSSDQTNRNPLTESATIPSNSDSNRKSSSGSENKTPKTGTNAPNEANNNNNPKLRARASKKSASPTQLSACGWCSDTKPILKYILPTLSGENLQFCSENCLAEFRKAVKKGACKQCGNVVRLTIAPNKEYCSMFCMNKAMPKNGRFGISSCE